MDIYTDASGQMTAARAIKAGELVTVAINGHAETHRPTMAEYLRKREIALNFLASWRERGVYYTPKDALFWASLATQSKRIRWPPKRDLAPLPLP